MAKNKYNSICFLQPKIDVWNKNINEYNSLS